MKKKTKTTQDVQPIKTKVVEVVDINFTTKPTRLNKLVGKLLGVTWTTRKVTVEDKD